MKKNIILFSLMVAGSAVAAPQSHASANKGVKVFVSGFAGMGFARAADSKHSMYVYLTDVHRSGAEDYVKAHEKDVNPDTGAVYSKEDLIKSYGQANEFAAFLPGKNGEASTFVKDNKPIHQDTKVSGKSVITGVSTEVYFFHMDNVSVGATAGVAMPFGGVKEESEYLSFTRKSSVAPSVGLSLMYTHGKVSVEGAVFGLLSKEVFKVDALKRGELSDKEIDDRVAKFKQANVGLQAVAAEKTGEELKAIFKDGTAGESTTNWGLSLGLRVVATMRVLENTHLGAGVSYEFGRDFTPGKSSSKHAEYAPASSRDRTTDVASIGASKVKRPGVFSVMLFAKQQVK